MQKAKIRIGASEAAAPLGLDEFQSPGRYAAVKLGWVERDPENEATFLGRVVEESVARAFQERHDVHLRPWPSVKSQSKAWLGATPDRVIFPEDMSESFRRRFNVDHGEVVLWEGKSTGLASYQPPRKLAMKWGAPMTDEVPGRYVVQCQMQGHVMNDDLEMFGYHVDKIILSALLPPRGVVDFVLRFDRPMADTIITRLESFIDDYLVPEKSPPPETEEDWTRYGNLLRLPHGGGKTTVKLEPGTAVYDALVAFAVHHKAMEVHELGKAQARAALIAAIGDGYALEAEGVGRVLLTSPKEVSTPKLNKAKLADDVVDYLAEMAALDPTNPAAARLAALIAQHTKPHSAGRVLMPYLK